LAQLEGPGAAPNFGFVYATDVLAAQLPQISALLRARTGVDHWVGTVGLGVCSSGVEYFDEAALVVMLASFPADSFRVFSKVDSDLERFESEHGSWCARARPYFGVVHGDPRSPVVPSLVVELSRRMSGGFLVGGLAGSRSGQSYQLATGITQGGLSGVLFDDQVAVTSRLSQGCSPIGPRHTVSRADGNLVLELDGRAALDVFYEEVGEVLARNPEQAAGFIFAALPVKGSDTGDYLVRGLVGIDPRRKAIAIGEAVGAGDALMLCRRDAAAAHDDMTRMLREIRQSLSGPPRAGIYFSCVARGPNLFGPGARELGLIEREFGPIPLVGFFGNGEISHDRIYGFTGVLTLFA
jgi:small ligand-binding sensory domain FIST